MSSKKWKNKNFFEALKNSINGIKFAFKNELNLKIQSTFAIIAILFGVWLKLQKVEWAILTLTISSVFFAELLNTAIEEMLDLYTEEYNEKIKIVKDISSGAVLVTAFSAVVIGSFLFLPKLFNL